MKILSKILTVFLWVSILFPVSITAQDLKKQINEIKKNEKFLYSEGVAETKEEAYSLAMELLNNEIQNWVNTKKNLKDNSNILVKDIISHSEAITLPRGNMFRCFLYVNKSDISSANNIEILKKIPGNEIKEEQENVGQRKVTRDINIPETLKILLPIKEYSIFANKIMQLKEENKISHYARYASLSNPDIYYLAIYDKEGRMLAILSPGPDRINLNTGEPDLLTNYKGCGAIGFLLP